MLSLRRLLPRANNPLPAGDAERMPLAVLEFQSPTAAIIATPVPRMAASTNYFITALVFTLLVISAIAKTEKLVTAPGVMTSSAPDSDIQSFNTTSIVESINVHPGDLVNKGQVLATLNPTYATADLTAMTAQQQQYAAEVAELQAQENGTPYIPDPANPASALQLQTYNQQSGQYNFTMQDYAQKINALQTEIAGYKQQAEDYSQRLAGAQKVLDMRQQLEKLQVGSHLDTLSAKDTVISMQSQLSSALSSAASDERQLDSQIAERDGFAQQFKGTISTQLATALNSLYQAQQQLTKARLNDTMVALTAPQDSIVQSVSPLSAGSVVQAGQTIMDLAPVNAPFTVQANVPADQSGFVHVGNTATIKFNTLPFLEYGSAKGVVTSISPESFNPLDQQTNGAPTPETPRDLYYKAEVAIDVINLHNVPPGFRLVPGMPLTVDMVVGKQTILGYFTQRIIPIAYNSLHEP